MAMDGHHGNTWANWAAVVVGLVGVTIGSVAVLLDPVSWLWFWVGIALFLVAPIIAVTLTKAGLGAKH